MKTSKGRKDQITDTDISDLLSDLGHYRQQTQEVIDERVGRPLPGHSFEIRIDDLDADPSQPRRHFAEATLRALAESIADQGVLQPLLVRPTPEGRYLIVAGERRFRAARLAGQETVPCIVKEYNAEQALAVALTENIHRDDLSDMEKSDALVQLRELTGRSWKEIGGAVRLSHDRVMQLASLQTLAQEVKEQVRGGALSGRKALALRPLPPSEQVQLAKEAAIQGWTAEEIRARAQQELGKAPSRSSRPRDRASANDSVTRNGIVAPATVTTVNAEPVPLRTPAVIVQLNEQVQLALRLLRSTSGTLVEPEVRETLLQGIAELRQLLTPDEAGESSP